MTDAPTSNGATNGADSATFDTSNVLHALELIHSPATKNEVRRQASEYLENLKASNDAPQYGFALSTDRSQPPLVQHFGLSLLSHVIRHEGHNLSEEQSLQLRHCVLDLGRAILPSDLTFIRNKVAELWIELAKRSWALDWFDLDEQLVQLWSQDLVHKDFILTVLENLSEDIFVRDDNIAVLRGRDLNSALVEIFTSSSNFAGGIKIGGMINHVRFGNEGWLVRIKLFLDECGKNQSMNGAVKDAALKALATLRSAFIWVMTPAVIHSMALAITCNFLTQSDPDLVMAAVDGLLSLYGRTRLEEVEVQALVHPLIQPDSISTFQQLYEWSIVSVNDIDSSKYTISKKLSELISLLADHLCQYAPPDANSLDLSPFLHFLIRIAEHESLIVSIPAVHSWVKLLEVSSWRKSPAVLQCVGPLLQIASQRLIQYDQLPEDTQDPVVIFVNEEIELFPERQGFYLNYRRLCSGVVEWICYAQLEGAMQAVLKRADDLLDEVEVAEQQFDPHLYERASMNVLKADAYFAMIDAAFKGLEQWQMRHGDGPAPGQEQLGQKVRETSKQWMLDMMKRRTFKDPQIRQRQIKTAVEVSNRALQKDTGFAFNVLEHILSSFIIGQQQHSIYAEAVIELHNYAASELRRLSLQHADYFVTFYDQLQTKFTDLSNQLGADERLQIDLKSTLFSVIQRAAAVDYAEREAKLREFLQPIAAAWADEGLQATLRSFEAFTHSQAFDQIAPYMASMHAGDLADWSQVPYDGRAVQIQQEMLAGYTKLPLRESRILLSISTERLDEGSGLHKMVCDLWSPMIPNLLSHVLRLTSYNHQLHNPTSWPNVTPELEGVIQRILRDRYWQSGISTGSMNEFHSKVKLTKASLEGFASSVRGRIRNNLEQCYSIIHTLGRLGPVFYGLQQVPEMLAEATLDTATSLSPHHFSVMLQMLPKLIDECPPESRQQFLTPILSSLLDQLDTKLSSEWVKMDQRKQIKHDEENLGDEMRDDSVLRQTTYKAANLVAHWLNPRREINLSSKKSLVNGHHLNPANQQQTMRQFLLSNVRILDRLLIFVTHALAFRDMRSCYAVLVAVQRLVPDFASDEYISGGEAAAVRDFMSTETLKTAITCLHDGYFADHQQYYAQLIATIWLSYGLPAHVPATETTPAHDRPALTSAPRDVILSLPGMSEAKVAGAAAQLAREGLGARSKKLRAIVLSLLEGVRGVRVSELGKFDMRQQQSKILEKYKQRELLAMRGRHGADDAASGHHLGVDSGNGDDGVDLAGLADMFAN